jgi:hypothetical protein
LRADKQQVIAEILRVLPRGRLQFVRSRGRLQFAEIANGRPVPAEALRGIDLRTG